MAEWSYERRFEVDAALTDAWHFFSDLEGVVEWNKNLIGHEVIKGPPNEVGSEVNLRFRHGDQETESYVTTLEREELKRIVQSYRSGDHTSVGEAVFSPEGFDRTAVTMTMRFEMSTVPWLSRPLRKTMVKVMARDMIDRYSAFLTARTVDALQATFEGNN